MVDIIVDPSREARAMIDAELDLRKALSLQSPAERAEALLRQYRLSSGDVRHAMVMGLISRVAVANQPSGNPQRLCTECGTHLPLDQLHICRDCRVAA